MNIWIFNHHALTPDMAGGTRHYDFAKELVSLGHQVTIIASSFHYATHQEQKEYGNNYFLKENQENINFIWIKTRPYTANNGLGRIYNMLDYMLKSKKIMSHQTDVPDIIVGSSVHLFAVYSAYLVAKKLHVPFVMEVRDLWPQTLIDMGISKWHPFILLLSFLEKFLYKKATLIISLLPHAKEYISQRSKIKEDKIIWIPNGVNVERNLSIIPYNYPPNQFHIVYAGAIGEANEIDSLIYAANALSSKEDIQFHIIGDGPKLETIKNLSNKFNLKNTHFYGSISKEAAIAMMNGANVLFFPLKDSPVFRFGISSNKLFDYLAAQKPIIFASNAKNNPVAEAHAGISVKSADIPAIVTAIQKLKNSSSEQLRSFGENGLNYVEKNHDIKTLTLKLLQHLKTIRYNA